MKLLVFRHVPFEDLGVIAPLLEAQDIACEYADLWRNAAMPPLDSVSGIISMGGPMSANDNHPHLVREIHFMEEALRVDKPILGICLGSQLLAKACGASVYKNAVQEIGWAPVSWTRDAHNDPLFEGLADPETVLHWHGETFDIPAGGEWLAYSEDCPHQAFRAGARAYGLQFHLEVTPEIIADWLQQEDNRGDVAGLTEVIDPHHNATRLKELAELVFGRWMRLLRQ